MWVARGNRLLRGRRRGSVSRTSMIALEQADASGTDTTLGKSQQQILKELGAFKTPTPGTPSAADDEWALGPPWLARRRGHLAVRHPAASARTESREAVAHFCDESFTPEVAWTRRSTGRWSRSWRQPPRRRRGSARWTLRRSSPSTSPWCSSTWGGPSRRARCALGSSARRWRRWEAKRSRSVWRSARLTQPTGADRVKRLFNCDLVNVQGVYSCSCMPRRSTGGRRS